MTGRWGSWWMAALVTSAALGASLGEAVAAPPGGGPRGDQMARVKALRGRVLREKVGLDEARAVKIEAIFDRYQPERRSLRKTVRQTMRSLRELVDSNAADDQAYSAAFAQLKATQDKLRDLRDRQQAEVSRIVTPREAAKLLLTMKKARFEGHRHRFEGRFRHGGGGGGRHWQRGQGAGPEDGGGFGPPPRDGGGPGGPAGPDARGPRDGMGPGGDEDDGADGPGEGPGEDL